MRAEQPAPYPGLTAQRRAVPSLALAVLTTLACESGQAAPRPRPSAAPASTEAAHRAPPPRWVRGPSGAAPLAPFVYQQLREAQPNGEEVLVYVGASWCEPCRRFHDALVRGDLDDELRGVRFIEMDHDADAESLRGAGYSSKLIPLFALPADDGRSSGMQVEGSIKGSGAVRSNLLPRLRRLLGRERSPDSKGAAR